ncbi:hypothetical protein Lfu02_61140 [Longispora fulva]|uniref:helix-turn-helix domain-containing protein n=1 Tax=Longispora fulva TaxID=619741 RepID=UPI0019404DA3|nr:helix-turn-helix domain-containing protein [Longispora fulva]GIG61742.1 hypothetical protein Lfu02_61140 [Longispora fulva]
MPPSLQLQSDRQAQRRLAVLRHVEEVTGSVAQTCRYYGISRNCFYKWQRRYQEVGLDDAGVFNDKLQEWEDYYNYHRPYGGLAGQTPYERLKQKPRPRCNQAPADAQLAHVKLGWVSGGVEECGGCVARRRVLPGACGPPSPVRGGSSQ